MLVVNNRIGLRDFDCRRMLPPAIETSLPLLSCRGNENQTTFECVFSLGPLPH